MPITPDNLREVMTYHAPSPEQLEKLARVREGAIAFASIVMANAPQCADTSAALRDIRNAKAHANEAIVLSGMV